MSARRFALDTNVLVYLFDHRDAMKQKLAEQLVVGAATCDCMLALQAVGEFYVAATRKKILGPADAAREAQNFLALFASFPSSQEAHRVALREAPAGRYAYWDAVMLASAAEAGCAIFLSEDMKDGSRLGDITVRNPFGAKGLSAAATAALAP